MVKYLVFEYESYYPSGGMSDCELITDSKTELIEYVKTWAEMEDSFPSENIRVYDIDLLQHIFEATINKDYSDTNNIKNKLIILTDELNLLDQ